TEAAATGAARRDRLMKGIGTQELLLVLAPVLFFVLLGLGVGLIASAKGCSFGAWWFYGAVVFPVAFLHVILHRTEPEVLEEKALRDGDAKSCPFCAEVIKVEASVCRACGRDVLAEELRPRRFAG
ncbi:MAG: hypothetical protein ACRDGM_18585, partial [bacterium]